MGLNMGSGGMTVLGLGRQQSGGYSGGSDHFPPILDPSEFPSLTSRNIGQGDGYHQLCQQNPTVVIRENHLQVEWLNSLCRKRAPSP